MRRTGKWTVTEHSGTRLRTALLALGLTAGSGCAENGSAPNLDSIDDQTAVVGQELVINLRATDPDGDEIDFEFSAPDPDIQEDGTLTRRPDGTAVFRWTPLAGNVGTWFFDFHAVDEDGRSTVTALVEVTETGGDGSAPLFREPLGSGTTLDLAQAACLDVPVVVEDPDDAMVALGTAAPLEGAELTQSSGVEGVWRWCPSKAQLEEDRYPVTFFADDGAHEPTLKNFLVVLRSAPKSDCPGEIPTIGHIPMDVTTRQDLEITADIVDAEGLAREPLLYFTFEEPKLPVDFGSLDVVEMELASGDMTEGTWTGRIPNPVANGAEGDAALVYYIISAKDNDDPDGDCDHLVDSPAEGAYFMQVTNGGGMGGAEACEPCSADVQCGGQGDLCAPLDGDEVCLTACGDGDACGEGLTCGDVTSVDGVATKQCVPDTGTCSDPKTECTDDEHEDNDSQAAAVSLPEGEHALTSCAGEDSDDEDWFSFDVAEGNLTVEIDGGNATNLQLALFDEAGDTVAVAETAGSDESIHECLPAGTYYARVHTFDTGENDYTLSWNHAAHACGGDTCEPDDLEDDDTTGQATYAEVFPDGYSVTDRTICSGDDDFYRVELYTGETLEVDLTFTQTADDEDLDLHFFDPDGTDLTPCSEAAPGTCSVAQGQSVTSNEHYEYTVEMSGCSPCSFWVSVHGWDGAENDYDLDLALQ